MEMVNYVAVFSVEFAFAKMTCEVLKKIVALVKHEIQREPFGTIIIQQILQYFYHIYLHHMKSSCNENEVTIYSITHEQMKMAI